VIKPKYKRLGESFKKSGKLYIAKSINDTAKKCKNCAFNYDLSCSLYFCHKESREDGMNVIFEEI
jgi:hypothetical protein